MEKNLTRHDLYPAPYILSEACHIMLVSLFVFHFVYLSPGNLSYQIDTVLYESIYFILHFSFLMYCLKLAFLWKA
jgi:hypothetical protein